MTNEDENLTVDIYTPNRLLRRKLAGLPCDYCGNGMTMKDIVAVKPREHTYPGYMHPRCLEILVKESSPEADAGGTPASTDKE